MKKAITIILSLVLIVALIATVGLLNGTLKFGGVSTKIPDDPIKSEFEQLRQEVEDAGYKVSDAYVDASFKEVISAFAVKVNFDANTIATIPIILTETEEAAITNCEMFGTNSIKKPVRNGRIFSYPGKDYPENVLSLVDAIVNRKEIPANTFVNPDSEIK